MTSSNDSGTAEELENIEKALADSFKTYLATVPGSYGSLGQTSATYLLAAQHFTNLYGRYFDNENRKMLALERLKAVQEYLENKSDGTFHEFGKQYWRGIEMSPEQVTQEIAELDKQIKEQEK